jgi:hypothetical protein
MELGLEHQILDLIISVLKTLLGLLGAWLVKRAIDWFQATTKIRVEEATKKKIDDAVILGIAKAEEWGRKRFISSPHPSDPAKVELVPVTGDLKMEQAKKTARAMAAKELAKVDEVRLEDIIDAKLNLMRHSVSLIPPSMENVFIPKGPLLPQESQSLLVAREDVERVPGEPEGVTMRPKRFMVSIPREDPM